MADPSSRAFDRLAPALQRWIWREGWDELRDIQEQAIPLILDGRDVLISSATASGKTEAAFLPICTALAGVTDGLGVLYVAPLKALINDQARRLEAIFEAIDLPVTPWHGDVSSSIKRRLIDQPRGGLLITPESLEALFVTRGSSMPRIAADLHYVVIDELHAFIGTERGRQLQSLLHRVEIAAKRRLPRIALSATLGDLDLAAEFLRPGAHQGVERVTSSALGREVQLQVRGYRVTPPPLHPGADGGPVEEARPDDVSTGDDIAIGQHLYATLRGGMHLVFANRRTEVERFADLLRRLAEREGRPNEFFPHHGSLSRELREEAEERLQGTRPTTVIATTTLELGIDIRAVDSIAQIGPPGSVASLRQRLGRSGRRPGAPSVLRAYVQEPETTASSPPQDQLRPSLVQAIAMIQLLIDRWVEPPAPAALHLSTLVQQVLSLTAQHGGFRAADAYRALCVSGPFSSVDQGTFAQLLRDLATHELVRQTHDDLIVLDLKGERIVNHFDFYAAFTVPDEWKLLTSGRPLGTLPVTFPLAPDLYLIFAGRRWRITGVNEERREVDLEPAPGGVPPQFGGAGALIHDRVRAEMKRVYLDTAVPRYLDAAARDLLAEGRDAFQRLRLHEHPFVRDGRDAIVFPWAGDRIMHTLALQLRARGLAVAHEAMSLVARDTSPHELHAHMRAIAGAGPADALTLAAAVENKHTEKHHVFLSDELLAADYASSQLDAAGAWETAVRLTDSVPERAPVAGVVADRVPDSAEVVTSVRPAPPLDGHASTSSAVRRPAADDVPPLRGVRFAAVDFETATGQRHSACALGLVLVEDGKIVTTRRWLIRPPGNEYAPFNIRVHGIRPADTATAPAFPAVWDEARALIADRPLVAHNAAFDLAVLRASLDIHGTRPPTVDAYCTLLMSRSLWPGLTSYSLPLLSRFLDVHLSRHHDPVADATACAEIALKACTAAGVDQLQRLAERLDLQAGFVRVGAWSPPHRPSRAADAGSAGPGTISDPTHPLYGRCVAFTGTLSSMSRREAAQRVTEVGGYAMGSVSARTDYLVFGEQDFSKFVGGEHSAKTRRAAELAAAGHPIEILSEVDFFEMLQGGS